MTNIQEAKDSRAVKHVVYWKLNNSQSSAEDGAASPTKSSQPFKVILLSSVRTSGAQGVSIPLIGCLEHSIFIYLALIFMFSNLEALSVFT